MEKKTMKGYVGATSSKRKRRDKQHLERRELEFEKVLNGDCTDWEVVTLCKFENKEQRDRLEPLFIIILNTSAERKKPLGFNMSAG